jgi:serine/threonine protein kinase
MGPGMPTKYITTFSEYTPVATRGEGGSGYVFEVIDDKGQRFALKALKPQWITRDRRRRFKNEILFCQRASHPNIVPVIDHGVFLEAGGPTPFYVMPLYACSLRKMMKEHIPQGSIMPFFSQILDGVEAAHLQGVVHRDLKPENILYDEARSALVIADFGIAQFQQEDLYTAIETKAADRLANFNYAAPEQRERGLDVDLRADIYALGLILNEMFTHQIPLGTGYKTIASVSDDFAYLSELVLQMIRQSRDARPSSLGVIKAELIARGNAFVAEQRLSQVKQTVIPKSEIDDPLLTDPVHIKDFDWGNDTLTLILSRPVTPKWVSALNSMGNYRFFRDKGPEAFTFRGDHATVRARENEVQDIINCFKEWLPLVARRYERILRDELAREEQKRRAELQARIQEEEARARLRRNVKL